MKISDLNLAELHINQIIQLLQMLGFLRNKRIMVVVAHPDDELLGCGATMNKLINEYSCSIRAVILGEGITSRSEKRETETWVMNFYFTNKTSVQQQNVLVIPPLEYSIYLITASTQ